MTSTLSIRSYCLTPSGQLRRLSLSGMSLFHFVPCPVVVSEFSGCSIRFGELVVRMIGRKPADIERTSYTLIRFTEDGRPDMERYRRESSAAMDLHWDSVFKTKTHSGNVIDMKSTFQGMGCRWKPRPAEAMEFEKAALGLRKVKWLVFSEETFALDEDSQVLGLTGGLEATLPADPDNIPF